MCWALLPHGREASLCAVLAVWGRSGCRVSCHHSSSRSFWTALKLFTYLRNALKMSQSMLITNCRVQELVKKLIFAESMS